MKLGDQSGRAGRVARAVQNNQPARVADAGGDPGAVSEGPVARVLGVVWGENDLELGRAEGLCADVGSACLGVSDWVLLWVGNCWREQVCVGIVEKDVGGVDVITAAGSFGVWLSRCVVAV